MHLPDGFVSPKAYLPAWGVAVLVWWLCLRRTRSLPDVTILPRLSVLTAAAFVLSLVTIPLPGGSSVHLIFTGLLTALFGFRLAFLALSLVLVLQAFLLGDGGVTTLAINALAIAGAGSAAAALVIRVFGRGRTIGLFLAGWSAVVVPALLLAVVLGLQPALAHDDAGVPLYFPFDVSVTLPALVLPHLALGVAEGLLTVLGWRFWRAAAEGAADA